MPFPGFDHHHRDRHPPILLMPSSSKNRASPLFLSLATQRCPSSSPLQSLSITAGAATLVNFSSFSNLISIVIFLAFLPSLCLYHKKGRIPLEHPLENKACSQFPYHLTRNQEPNTVSINHQDNQVHKQHHRECVAHEAR
ncbi:uncharacterized protein DS421_13g413920 [Arachis hypogaea]|nr:uncharacterized protein DS421_13g413920 [Arachis hypogaea]